MERRDCKVPLRNWQLYWKIKQTIRGEHVWQEGEALGTKAMEEADLTGKSIR